MRYWFQFGEDFHCVNGDFEFVSDLCSAVHDKLGQASPGAVCIQLIVAGKTLCPSDECAEMIPTSVSLHPKKDVNATPIELFFQAPRVGSHRPSRRSTPSGRPSSGGRSRQRYHNPQPVEDDFTSTSCDEATLVAACRSANRNLRRFDRNPALRGRDYFDHHMERIADQLHNVHAQKYPVAPGTDRPPTSPKVAEWVVMLCPPGGSELQTRCIPCPSSRPTKCLDVIRHIQRQVSDFLISEAFYYDESFKDYVALNDTTTQAMSGLLFVLCKPHRGLDAAGPQAPRPDNLRHTVMMSDQYSPKQSTPAPVAGQDQQAVVEAPRPSTTAHSPVNPTAPPANRSTTPQSRKPWYERISPAGTPSKELPPKAEDAPKKNDAAAAQRISPKRAEILPVGPVVRKAGQPIQTPAVENPIKTPPVQDPIQTPPVPAAAKMSPCDPALASGIVHDTVSAAVDKSEASKSRPSSGKRLLGLPGSTEHLQKHHDDHWGAPSKQPEESPASPVVMTDVTNTSIASTGPQWGLASASAAPAAGTTSNNASFSGAAAPFRSSSPVIPPVAPKPGLIRAEDPQWGLDNSKKPVGVEKPTTVDADISVQIRQHEHDHWGLPTPSQAHTGPQWGIGAHPPTKNPQAPSAVGVPAPPTPLTVATPLNGGCKSDGTFLNDGVRVGSPVALTAPSKQESSLHVGGYAGNGQLLNNGVQVDKDEALLNVRECWFDHKFLSADAKEALGFEFFKLALMQHPNLARGLMKGWDLVLAAAEYNAIIDLVVRGGLTAEVLKAKIATARTAGFISTAYPVSERHYHYFITTTITALLSLIPPSKQEEFTEFHAEAWRRVLTGVTERFAESLGVQTGHVFQTESTLTAQVLALEGPGSAVPAPSAVPPPSAMLNSAGSAQPGTPTAQTIAPIPEMVLASKEQPTLSAIGAVPESTVQTSVGELADVAPEVRSGGASTPKQQTIAPIQDVVLASLEKPQLTAVGEAPVTTLQTNVGDLAEVAPQVRGGGATTPKQQTIAPIPEMVLASKENPTLSAVGAVPETKVPTSVGALADNETAVSKSSVVGYAAPSFVPFAGTKVKRSDYKTRLAAFFSKYCPEMCSVVDETLQRVKGSEDALFTRLTSKYGPEPVEVVSDEEFSKAAPAVTKVEPSSAGQVAAPTAAAGQPPQQEEEPTLGELKKGYSNYEV